MPSIQCECKLKGCKAGTGLICAEGAGSVSSRLMFLGESLGAEGVLYRKPLAGTAEKILDKLFLSSGLNKSEYFFSNTICFRPTVGVGDKIKNRTPKVSEVQACAEHLDKEIEMVHPELIICMGATAIKRILGTKAAIQQGEFVYSEKYKCQVFYTFNPLMVLRDPGCEFIMQKHFTLIARYLKGESIETPKIEYCEVRDKETLDWMVDRLNSVEVFATDIETSGFDRNKDKIGVIGFSWKAGTGVSVPLLHEDGSPFWDDYSWMKQVLENKALKVVQNLNMEWSFFLANGINTNNLNWDTMMADFLLEENREHDLKSLAWVYTKFGGYEKDLERYKKEYKFKKTTSYLTIPHNILLPYCATDCACTFEIYEKQKILLEKEELTWLYENMMVPCQHLLNRVQARGVYVDKGHTEQISNQLTNKINFYEKQFNEQVVKYGGCKMRSTKQLKDLFFNKLGLKSVKKVKGTNNDSVDKEVLKVLGESNEIAKTLSEGKKLIGKNNYLKGVLKKLDESGRIHTTYSLSVEVTGRISSKAVNLQNCPKEKESRNIFIATPGYKLAEYDESTFELRILTGITKDAGFLKIFSEGLDPHTTVGCRIFKVPPEQITDKMRMVAKTVSFGIVYGRGKYTLAETLKCTVEEAEEYLKQYFKDHPQISSWVYEMRRQAIQNRYVCNLFGRRRRFPGVEWANQVQLNEIGRQAQNSPIQSLGNDIVCLAALRIDKRFQEENIDGFLVLTVHDALVYEIKEDQFDKGCSIIKEEMERRVVGLDIDLKAEGKFGYKWGEIAKQDYTEVREEKEDSEEKNEEEEADA